MTALTILVPSPQPGSAIEERYAGQQLLLLLRRQAPQARVEFLSGDRSAAEAARGSEYTLVVTDPLIVPSPRLLAALEEALRDHPDVAAALPLLNQSAEPRQVRTPPAPYLTLRQFDEVATSIAHEASLHQRLRWSAADPGVFLTRTETLDPQSGSAELLDGKDVVLVSNAWCHRYASLRGQLREDLLSRVSADARSVLEFGCGEGALGAALKSRQTCRVVGVELDLRAAGVARERLDHVHTGDVRLLIAEVTERFDFIVGGDIVEHLDDPWTFLADLRALTEEGGTLLLSLPNIGAWPIIADLLQGRFDYLYMGITCAGHLRFFTRQSIEDMLVMAGWEPVSIEPQDVFITPEYLELEEGLRKGGIGFSRDDLLTPGYYVLARNPA